MVVKIIKFIIKDLIDDAKFIIAVCKGKAKLRKIERSEWKELRPSELFKENYIWFFLLVLAFLVGKHHTAKAYQDECNEYIIENYIKPQYEKVDSLYHLFEHTKGAARHINNVCRAALLLGATEHKKIIDETDLKRVILDLDRQLA